MAKWVDARDLKSLGFAVPVRVRPSLPFLHGGNFLFGLLFQIFGSLLLSNILDISSYLFDAMTSISIKKSKEEKKNIVDISFLSILEKAQSLFPGISKENVDQFLLVLKKFNIIQYDQKEEKIIVDAKALGELWEKIRPMLSKK